MGGGGRPPVLSAKLPIIDPKAAFDSPRLKLSEYVAKLYLTVTDDISGRVKDRLLNLSSLASPGKTSVSY